MDDTIPDNPRIKEWLEAWQSNKEWRSDFLYHIARELSKTGSLGAHEHVFRSLSQYISKDEAITIYTALQASGRPDFEWKREFLAIFTCVKEAELPKPIVDEEEAKRFAAEELEKSILEGVHPFVPDDQIPF